MNNLTWDEIQRKIIPLRKLMQIYNWNPDSWYDFTFSHEPLDEMLIEGYVNRTVINDYRWYQITEAGLEQYLQWVELAVERGWIYDTKVKRGQNERKT